MNTNILVSLLVIGLAATAIGGSMTGAFFSSAQTSTGNTITAGTIDLTVNGESPLQSKVVNLPDLKPGYERNVTKILKVTNNPSNAWMQIANIADIVGNHKMDAQIYYYLTVCQDTNNNNVCDTGETNTSSYMDKDKETLATLNGKWIELWKDLPPNTQLIVIQNFHFNESAGNEYQGDQITFTENFAAYQLEAPTPTGNILYLENKDATTWTNITDGMSGTLAYNSAGPTFDYTFTGQGLQASTDYCLIYYADTWAGNNPGAFIADMTTDGTGAVTKTGSAALGISLPTLPDPRYPAGAKIWLVPCSDYNSNTRTTGPITTWDPTKFLFENNPILINYKYTP